MDSINYINKKTYFDSLLTICGRKPVLEAMQANGVKAEKLHLSEKNRPAKILDEITQLASSQRIAIEYHSASELSRISKSAKQDQGVALDIKCPNCSSLDVILSKKELGMTVIALDRVTNPQNIGMIVRSVAASPSTALILPRKGCAPLNALVIKASAGNLFKAPIVRVESLESALSSCQKAGYQVASLEADAPQSLLDARAGKPTIFVLGNETDGV